MMRVVGALIASVAVASGALQADERQPRIVFNDDAQMLMETPAEGTTEFVKQWLKSDWPGRRAGDNIFEATLATTLFNVD